MVCLVPNRGKAAKGNPEKAKSQVNQTASANACSTPHNPSKKQINAQKLKQNEFFASHAR
jgi:hypothetical protein